MNNITRREKIRKIYGKMFSADPLTISGRATLHYVEFLEEGALRYQELLKELVNKKEEEK